MPDVGKSAHPRHELSIILSGRLQTTIDGETEVLEDTHLVYIFFDK